MDVEFRLTNSTAINAVRRSDSAVVSPGGELFLVYTVVERRISNVWSHNECAAGWGEFFDSSRRTTWRDKPLCGARTKVQQNQ